MTFKWIFGVLTSGCMFYFLVLTRNSIEQRLFTILFFGAGLTLIIEPESTNRVAHALRVGRGADLIFYLSTLFLFFVCFNFYLRFKAQQRMITEITRLLALERPFKELKIHD